MKRNICRITRIASIAGIVLLAAAGIQRIRRNRR